MVRIFFLPYLGNRSKSDQCSYGRFCLESHILSFPKVLQIPPEPPCITCDPRFLFAMTNRITQFITEFLSRLVFLLHLLLILLSYSFSSSFYFFCHQTSKQTLRKMKISDLIMLYSLSCYRSGFVWWNVFMKLRRLINFTWYLFSALNVLWFLLHLLNHSVICFRLFPAKTVRNLYIYKLYFPCLGPGIA